MSQTLRIATRKGLFTLNPRAGSKWSIDRVDFLGANATMSKFDRRTGTLHVALNHGHFGCKMHRTNDEGQNWTDSAVPAYPIGEGETEETAPSLNYLWSLESGGDDQPGRLWMGTVPGGLFISNDHGNSWELNQPLWSMPEKQRWFGGGMDEPGIHSIWVDPHDSSHVVIGVSCGGVWITYDDGQTWQLTGDGMFAEFMPPDKRDDPAIQDPHLLVGCPANTDHFWVQHHNGVFRSTDGARSWSEVSTIMPSSFGFAVAVHPHDPNTAWFVPGVKDECRVPVNGKLVVARTSDGGLSFDQLSDGLPQQHAYDIVFRHGLAITDDGETLAMGSSTGNLWISNDGGNSWQHISGTLPQIYCVRFD